MVSQTSSSGCPYTQGNADQTWWFQQLMRAQSFSGRELGWMWEMGVGENIQNIMYKIVRHQQNWTAERVQS